MSAFASSETRTSAPGRSAFETASTSGISISPALIAWTPSPLPGMSASTTVSASDWTSTSFWPDPTVSTSTTSKPAASRTRTASAVASASPPWWPRLAIERMKTPGSRKWSARRMRSPSTAPRVNGLVGSTLTTATDLPARRSSPARPLMRVLLPAPGGPVIPTRHARPVSGWRAATSSRPSGPSRSARLIARPIARRSPARTPAMSGSSVTPPRRAHRRPRRGSARSPPGSRRSRAAPRARRRPAPAGR